MREYLRVRGLAHAVFGGCDDIADKSRQIWVLFTTPPEWFRLRPRERAPGQQLERLVQLALLPRRNSLADDQCRRISTR